MAGPGCALVSGAVDSGLGLGELLVQPGVALAVGEVDGHADHEPDGEEDPGLHGQVGHQVEAQDGRDDREHLAERHAEGRLQVRALLPQHQDAEAHHHEGGERADVDHFLEQVHVGQAGHNRHGRTADDLQADRRRADGAGLGQRARQQAVAAHGQDHAGEAHQQHHDHGGQAHQGAEGDDLGGVGVAHGLERGGEGRVLRLGQLRVGHHAGQGEGDQDVEHGDDGQAAEDAARQGLLRVLDLLGGGGDDVEADEGEEDQGGAGEDAQRAVLRRGSAGEEAEEGLLEDVGGAGAAGGLGGRNERGVVLELDVGEADHDHKEDDGDLDQGEDVADAGGQLGPQHQQHGEDGDDQEGAPVEVDAAEGDRRRDVHAHQREHLAEVDAPVLGDHGRGGEELEDEVPADDPGQQLAHGGVGEDVGGAGHRDGGGEFGVAHDRQRTGDGGDGEGEGHGRAGEVRGSLGADREDAGADGNGDAHDHQVPGAERALQLASGFIGVGDRLLDGFGPEKVHRKVHNLGNWLETDLSIVVSIHWTARFVPHRETKRRAGRFPRPARPRRGSSAVSALRFRPAQTGQSISVDRIRNRLPSGASTENPLPRPGTTSTVRWVWLQ